MPCLQQFLAVTFNHLSHVVQFMGTISITEFENHRHFQPELRVLLVLPYMNMRRLIAVTCIKLKSMATHPKDNWHRIPSFVMTQAYIISSIPPMPPPWSWW